MEPTGYSDKFQGKPPSGKRNNAKDSLPKNLKLELLPPRFQKKYLADNGYTVPTSNPGTSTEDSWNGGSITFQVKSRNITVPVCIFVRHWFIFSRLSSSTYQYMIIQILYWQYQFQQGSSGYNYPPAIQHSQTMQNLPPSGPLPPQSSWSNTVPARSRGRGRIRPEELEAAGSVFRPVTPEQYSAPSSRSHTPSQEYINR